NKKTIAMEEELARKAGQVVDRIVLLANAGNATAMRICAEWAKPGGNSRALALELPRITCADDAQLALDMVIDAFGAGEITVREFPPMPGSGHRPARTADHIAQMRQREQERRQIRGETHPSLLPRPVPDPLEPIFAAIDRGEDPFADDPGTPARETEGDPLYSPVNSHGEEASRTADEISAADAAPSAAAA